jgi:hypothetical protein
MDSRSSMKQVALGGLLGLVLFGGGWYLTRTPTPADQVDPSLWDGKKIYFCFGDMKVRIEGRTIALPKGPPGEDLSPRATAHCQEPDCPLIRASSYCEIEIVDCKLSAPTVLEATGHAKVRVVNSTLEGKIIRDDRAELSGVSPTPPPPKKKSYGDEACAGIVKCYMEADEMGNVAGRLSVDIGADGRATDAHFKGKAGKAVVNCLVALGRSRQIAGFEGPPGQLVCDWAGSVTPGSVSMNKSGSFTR